LKFSSARLPCGNGEFDRYPMKKDSTSRIILTSSWNSRAYRRGAKGTFASRTEGIVKDFLPRLTAKCNHNPGLAFRSKQASFRYRSFYTCARRQSSSMASRHNVRGVYTAFLCRAACTTCGSISGTWSWKPAVTHQSMLSFSPTASTGSFLKWGHGCSRPAQLENCHPFAFNNFKALWIQKIN